MYQAALRRPLLESHRCLNDEYVLRDVSPTKNLITFFFEAIAAVKTHSHKLQPALFSSLLLLSMPRLRCVKDQNRTLGESFLK